MKRRLASELVVLEEIVQPGYWKLEKKVRNEVSNDLQYILHP